RSLVPDPDHAHLRAAVADLPARVSMIRQATAAALAVLCLWACKGDADFSDAMPAPVTLNADVFRREISDIDRLVFEEKPFVETRREALASRLEDLARRAR